VEVTHIPGTKDNQDKVSNLAFVEGCPQLVDSLMSATDSSALEEDNLPAVLVAETLDMGDRLVEIEAPPREMQAMHQTHALDG